MGKRTLDVSIALLVELFKASGAEYRYRVLDNALPEDACLVRVEATHSGGIIRLVLESAEWPAGKPYKPLPQVVMQVEIVGEDELPFTMIHDDDAEPEAHDE